jgi:hypothetical protein
MDAVPVESDLSPPTMDKNLQPCKVLVDAVTKSDHKLMEDRSHQEENDDDAHNDAAAADDVVQHRRRAGLLIFSCLYTVFYVGAFYGWGPMQLLVRIVLYDK